MSTIKTPEVTFNLIPGGEDSVGNKPNRVLFIGQIFDAGDPSVGIAAPETLIKVDPGKQDELFGERSMLAIAITEFFAINTRTEVWAMPVADPSNSTAAEAKINLDPTATASEADTLTVAVQSNVKHRYTIQINKGDTGSQILGRLADTIKADVFPRMFEVTIDAAIGELKFTCYHKGVIGNDLFFEIEKYPVLTGFTLNITPWGGGTGVPTVTNALANIGENRFQYISYPYNYDLPALKTFLNDRWNTPNDILDGVAIIVHRVDKGSLQSIINQAISLNTQTISLVADQFVVNQPINGKGSLWGSGSLEYHYTTSAKILAVRTLSLVEGADVTKYMSSTLNNIVATGGPQFNSIPYHNVEVPNSKIIAKNLWFTLDEYRRLTDKGVATFGNNPGETKVVLGDMVTTRTRDDNGLPNDSLQFMTTVNSATYYREYAYNNNRNEYSQTLLTPNPRPNKPETSERLIGQFQVKLYQDMADLGIVLGGDDAIKAFRDSLTVSANYETGNITMLATIRVAGAVRSIVGNLIVN